MRRVLVPDFITLSLYYLYPAYVDDIVKQVR